MTYSPSFLTRRRHVLATLVLELARTTDPTDRAYLNLAIAELTAEYNLGTSGSCEFS